MATMTSQTEPSGRDKLLHAAVGLLDDQGPMRYRPARWPAPPAPRRWPCTPTSADARFDRGGRRGGLRQFAAALACR
ncbi:hypothetical protein I552_0053 [Mycobacterium xenopi 3993]|nr:hypothetical protein I552_0053 [Mycobacterium xenopi 3993]